MPTDLPHVPSPQTVDLTGLPAETVQEVLRIVREAREKQAGPPPDVRPPLRGRFEPLGYSIPKEVLDEAQREAWAGFPRDFPGPAES